jgi:hypothetical protein
MGEAKRRKLKRTQTEPFSKELTRSRFDLYTLGTRHSMARVMAEELSWWADLEERMIGVVFRDRVDDDYGWNLLAQDRAGRFRWVKGGASIPSIPRATEALRETIAHTVQYEDLAELATQGDEPNVPFDLLQVPLDADRSKLHPYFRELLDRPGREPARAAVREIGPWLAPSDPNFVRQFQFDQFDQRLWELYLWAAFRELGFDVVQTEAPDFQCAAPGIAFTVEATTAAASTAGVLAQHPDPQTWEEMAAFLADYMPMKFGSCLTSKLNKRDAQGRHYWERDDSKGKPFILAVADFHKEATEDTPGSMTYTQSALWPYLYGHRVEWEMVDGSLLVRAVPRASHTFASKTVPSGFFDLPGAENVSAVLFSNAGTIAKFDRMGVVAGFVPADHTYLRVGLKYNHDPNSVHPTPFSEDVGAATYSEFWSDELQIFHNPNAKIPLPRDWLTGLAQHFFTDGQQKSFIPDGHTLSSFTAVMQLISSNSNRTPGSWLAETPNSQNES